ncbi:MAG: hypothetical protein QUS14_04550 [Pyrinomonadaceae bacterium]|nr:hypothetical protein [Pyrinomonadaceae bacterium]
MTELVNGCTGRACQYAIVGLAEMIGCTDGNQGCFEAMLFNGEPTKVHDEELEKATVQIQTILKGLSPYADGRKLSLLAIDGGFFLAWTNHDVQIPPDAVGQDADPAEVKAALKIIS